MEETTSPNTRRAFAGALQDATLRCASPSCTDQRPGAGERLAAGGPRRASGPASPGEPSPRPGTARPRFLAGGRRTVRRSRRQPGGGRSRRLTRPPSSPPSRAGAVTASTSTMSPSSTAAPNGFATRALVDDDPSLVFVDMPWAKLTHAPLSDPRLARRRAGNWPRPRAHPRRARARPRRDAPERGQRHPVGATSGTRADGDGIRVAVRRQGEHAAELVEPPGASPARPSTARPSEGHDCNDHNRGCQDIVPHVDHHEHYGDGGSRADQQQSHRRHVLRNFLQQVPPAVAAVTCMMSNRFNPAGKIQPEKYGHSSRPPTAAAGSAWVGMRGSP